MRDASATVIDNAINILKWRVAKYGDPYSESAFNPSMCTHTVVNTHLEQWAANAAAPGEQLGVRCLAQGSHLSRGIEGGESAGYSLPSPTIPAGPETQTHDLRVTSPTLYPLGHDCPHMRSVWTAWLQFWRKQHLLHIDVLFFCNILNEQHSSAASSGFNWID